MKINCVTGEGLARLLQVIESDQTKLKGGDKIKTIELEPEVSDPECFRFVKVLEVKPQEQGRNTYLVTLKVHLRVHCGDVGVGRFGRDGLLGIFRALHPDNLPSPDNGAKLQKMMTLLLSLEGKSFPHELCENEQGGCRVLIKENVCLTTDLILEKIFPRLEFVEFHGYRQNIFLGDKEPIKTLFEARDIAQSLNP